MTVRRTVASEPVARARSRKGSAGVSPAAVGVPPTARPPVRSVHPLHPPQSYGRRAQYCYGGRASPAWIKGPAWLAGKRPMSRDRPSRDPRQEPPPAPPPAAAAVDQEKNATATVIAFAGREQMIRLKDSLLDRDLGVAASLSAGSVNTFTVKIDPLKSSIIKQVSSVRGKCTFPF